MKIKPLRTFAAGERIFYTYAKEPYEVDASDAQNWALSGHCEIINDDEDKTPEQTENVENEAVKVDFEAMDYNELKAAGKEAGIKNYNTMKKKDLIAALKGV